MRITVVGTGHVGLVTSVAFATRGNLVVGLDIDPEKVANLQRGIAPFFEEGLDESLARETAAGRLRFTDDEREALANAEVVFICVWTPAGPEGESNLLAIESAAAAVARYAPDRTVVVQKSTVPVGTADRLRRTLVRHGGDRRFEVASNPEFLREGTALHDSLEPDRIVIGTDSQWSSAVLRLLYQPMVRSGSRLIETDIRSAELSKQACNVFLTLKISYANALARICELSGADVSDVADVMGADPRIGRAFLNAGLGYGGYCFPKDVAVLEHAVSELGYELPLLREIDRINREAVDAVARKVEDALWNLDQKRIAVFGLAFKPGTDDVRTSPALTLVKRLLAAGSHVVGYDPKGGPNAKEALPELEIASGPLEAASGAHCVVIATDWPEFREIDLVELRRVMAFPIVVDGRNLFDPEVMDRHRFWYFPTGRPAVAPDPEVAMDEAILIDAVARQDGSGASVG